MGLFPQHCAIQRYFAVDHASGQALVSATDAAGDLRSVHNCYNANCALGLPRLTLFESRSLLSLFTGNSCREGQAPTNFLQEAPQDGSDAHVVRRRNDWWSAADRRRALRCAVWWSNAFLSVSPDKRGGAHASTIR